MRGRIPLVLSLSKGGNGIRLRPAGSDAGHNGVRSIIASLGRQDFPRIRVGIGHPTPELGNIPHVISQFSEDEAPIISDAVKRVVEAVECLMEEGIDRAMNRFN